MGHVLHVPLVDSDVVEVYVGEGKASFREPFLQRAHSLGTVLNGVLD